jgi:hypothetical protein
VSPRVSRTLSDVAREQRCAYGPTMMIGLLPSWPARLVRLAMLVLGITSVPSVGLEAMQRPHCAQHEMAAQHERHMASEATLAHGHDAQAWTQRHDHGCPHCPASECARISPCTGSSTTAVTPSRAVIADLHGRRVAVDLDRQLAHSTFSTPDTPPPQLIA